MILATAGLLPRPACPFLGCQFRAVSAAVSVVVIAPRVLPLLPLVDDYAAIIQAVE